MRLPPVRSLQGRTRRILKYSEIILASASPRRRELVKKIDGFSFTVEPSFAKENYGSLSLPEDITMFLAAKKAQEVFERRGGLVLGADTVVATEDGKILGKPENFEQAEEMFRLLCGKTHTVVTGICLYSKEKKITKFEKTYVTFGAFNAEIVYNYIKSGNAYDKAGGYGIQDESLKPLIKRVDGDFDNVIGLPVRLVKEILKENF